MAEANAVEVKHRERILGKNGVEWTGKVEIRARKKLWWPKLTQFRLNIGRG